MEAINTDALEFSGANIPLKEAAKIMGKDYQFIRVALIQGKLDIGVAIKKEGKERYDFYISPKKFYEFTGYRYEKKQG